MVFLCFPWYSSNSEIRFLVQCPHKGLSLHRLLPPHMVLGPQRVPGPLRVPGLVLPVCLTVINYQLISIYYLINNYLLICSLITLKVYIAYHTISIFPSCWLNYVTLHFFLLFSFSLLLFSIYYQRSIQRPANLSAILWFHCYWNEKT